MSGLVFKQSFSSLSDEHPTKINHQLTMPCYGESCCDFCGCQVAATLDANDSDDEKYTEKYDFIQYGWLTSAEVIDEQGNVYENMIPNLMYELENDDQQYTNTCLHWVKEGGRLKEGVFLHNFCRTFIQNQTGWSTKQIFDILKNHRQKFVYDDHQSSIYDAIEDGTLVDTWRAEHPEKNEQNFSFFRQRIQDLLNTTRH